MRSSPMTAASPVTLPMEVILADTAQSRRIHYRLRYRVYCHETGFEDPTAFPDEEERDEYDDRAQAFLVRCTTTGEWVATARLILREGGPLPIESHCPLDPARVGPGEWPGAELSRLLIVGGQPRSQEDGAPFGKVSPTGDLIRSQGGDVIQYRTEILRRLMIGIGVVLEESDVGNLAFFLVPALKRVITRFGVECVLIGEPCYHRGQRFPYRVNVAAGLKALRSCDSPWAESPSPLPYIRFSELDLPSAIPLRPRWNRPGGERSERL